MGRSATFWLVNGAESTRSRWLQFPCVGDFAFVHRTNLRHFDSGHRCRITIQRGEFHLVGQTIPVNMHNASHITRFQSFGREIAF